MQSYPLSVKVNLIRRADNIKPGSLSACHQLFGNSLLTKRIRKYALENSWRQIREDHTFAESHNHKLAIALEKMEINLEN
jgi:hypothetical protein